MALLGGRYELEQALARDGQRRVWKGFDYLLEQPVVVKGVYGGDEARAILDEFARLRQFAHPRIARVHDLGLAMYSEGGDTAEPFRFFTQEWMPGPSLADLAGRLPAEVLHRCLIETLEVVGFLHRRRLTRLDLKPAHLILTGMGWRIIDLDQARIDDPLADGEPHGTLAYVAPEVLNGSPGGPQSDLYSLGAVLFHALTGSPPPFPGRTLAEVRRELPASPVPEVPADIAARSPTLVEIAYALLTRAPSARPASVDEVLQRLTHERGPGRHALSPLPESAFVGRGQAMREVDSLARAADQEDGGGILVRGPAKVGRSRFLAELAIHWQAQGRPALRFGDGTGQGRLAGGIDLMLRHLRAVAGLSIEGDTAVPQSNGGHSAEEAREEYVRSVLSRLREAGEAARAATGSLIPILIDEPELLDDLTQLVLRRLVLFLPGSGLLCVMAARDERRAADWDNVGLPVVVLPPFSAEEIRALAEDVLGPGALASNAEVEHLQRSTDGLVGWLRDALTIRWKDPGASLSTWSPTDSGRLVSVLVRDVGESGARLAVAASVLETPFSASLVAVLTETDPSKAELDALVEAGIWSIVPDPAGEELHFRYSRDGVRRAFQATLGDAERRVLHARAADALEAQAVYADQVRPAVIARHFVAAGMPERARPYLHRALDEAMRSLCLADAADVLRQLIAMARESELQLPELHRQLGSIELALEHFEAATTALEAALEVGDRLPAARRARCLADLAKALVGLGKLDRARDAVTAALASPAGLGIENKSLRVSWCQLLAWICIESGDRERAREGIELAAAEGVAGRSRLEVDQVHLEASLELVVGRQPQALVKDLARALELARQLGYARGEIKILTCLVQVCRLLNDWTQNRIHLEQLIQLTRANFDLMREAAAVHNLGECLEETGDLSAALEQYDLAARLYRRVGNRAREVQNRLSGADLLLQRQKTDRAEIELKQVAAVLDSSDEPLQVPRLAFRLLQARLLLQKRALEGLDARLEQIQHELEACHQARLALEAVADRMALAQLEGRPRDTLRLYAGLEARDPREGESAVWWRIHDLAIGAHDAIRPPRPSRQGGPVTPEPPELRAAEGQAASEDSAHAPEPSGQRETAPAPEPTAVQGNGEPRAHFMPAALAAEARPLVLDTLRLPPGADVTGALEIQPGRLNGSWRELVGTGGAGKAGRDGATGQAPTAIVHVSPSLWLQRVKRLVEVADEDEALAAELAALAGEMLSGRGLVFLFEGSRPQVVRSYRMPNNQVDDISITLIERVRSRRKPYICPDILVDAEVSQIRSLRAADVRCIICYPVMQDNACIGVVYVDHREVGRVSDDQAVAVVEQIATLTSDLLATIARRRLRISAESTEFGLIGTSPPMQRLRAQFSDLTQTTAEDLVVLLLGETGTGKSILARALHQHGRRAQGPFVAVNSAAIPEMLFESLMFGYVKAAFTGATENRAGWFEMANEGTLFLDEVGEMPIAQQTALLESLGGERKFRRVGDSREQSLNIHLFCATTRDLRAEVSTGHFRAELLRRIQINTCIVPPLRERGRNDIRLLACHMITNFLVKQKHLPDGAPVVALEDYFTRSAQEFMYQYPWPWNVGEMENLFRHEGIRRQLATAGTKVEKQLVELALGQHNLAPAAESPGHRSGELVLPEGLSYKDFDAWCEGLKAAYIRRVHRECQGYVQRTARRLNCCRDVVYKYLGHEKNGLEARGPDRVTVAEADRLD